MKGAFVNTAFRRLNVVVSFVCSTAAPLTAQSGAERAERMAKALVRLGPGGDTSQRYTIEQEMQRLRVTGASIAVVVGGRVVWAHGYGVKEFGKPERVDTTTLFLAGSISKPVFATGALALVEQGKLSLDTDINKSLTSWQLPSSKFTETQKVTLRRILSHSAGLTIWGFPGYAIDKPVPTVAQVLDGEAPANTRAVRNDTTPGARWLYSGGGITIAQLAATDATREAFPGLMKRLVLDKVGMVHSTYENPIPASRARETAAGHERPDSVVAGRWHVYPEMAAAGLWTTAPDLARWGIAIARAYRGESGGVLSPAMAREMVRPQTVLPTSGQGAAPAGTWWGLGVQVSGTARDFLFTHGGRDEGFVASFAYWPERDVGLVVLTNSTNGMFLNEVRRAFTAEFIR
ncbi:MAG TPA: serine hydrolase domain-containing protein [Gemmatimonadaceae bacterium]|nr:serine hydrolase domain-containing protein [Gemmatimonadaceae bacterium]